MKVGMSSFFDMKDESNFAALAAAGVDNIEISLGLSKFPDLNYGEVKTFADRHGVNLWSMHLPYSKPDVLDVASRDEDMRKKSVAYWCELIAKASDIGIDKFVIHPSSEPMTIDGDGRAFEIEQAMRSLRTLAEYAAGKDSIIAVEDRPRSCLGRNSDELLYLASADPRLGICFDTNHVQDQDLYDFAEKIAHKIVTMHVSDFDFKSERHWLPGEGQIDWQRLYKIVRAGGYDGVWLYEVGLNIPGTINRPREFTFSDFARNAAEIFEGRELTVIGVPKENLPIRR